jgi:hypothetical protein
MPTTPLDIEREFRARITSRLPTADPQTRRACNGNIGMGRLSFSDTPA